MDSFETDISEIQHLRNDPTLLFSRGYLEEQQRATRISASTGRHI